MSIWTVIVTVKVDEAGVVRLSKAGECSVELADVDEATAAIIYWASGHQDVDENGQVTFTDIGGGAVFPYDHNHWTLWAKHKVTGKQVRVDLYLREEDYWTDPGEAAMGIKAIRQTEPFPRLKKLLKR